MGKKGQLCFMALSACFSCLLIHFTFPSESFSAANVPIKLKEIFNIGKCIMITYPIH